MHRSRALAALLTLLLPAVALAQSSAQASIQRVERGLIPPVLVKGDPSWTIEERMKHHNVPGVSVAVIENFKVAWAKGYGVKDVETKEPVTARTLFQAGSISKPVAAMTALKKVEEGKLRLDEEINAKLTSWKLPDNELTAKRKVTLANLLSHTAGLTVHGFPGYASGEKVPSLPEILDGKAPANTPAVRVDLEPGTRFRYSGGGTTVTQLILEDVEKQPFDEIARKSVIGPIGMTDSTYSQPLPEPLRKQAASGHLRDGSIVPGKYHTYPEMAAAGLWTTPTDLAKFAIEVQLTLAGRSKKVISKEAAEKMVTPYISDDVGMGFFVEKHGKATYFGHNGADQGFLSMLLVHRDKGYGAVVMVNSMNPQIMSEIVRAVAREYKWEEYVSDPVTPVTLAPEVLDAYAGRYRVDVDTAVTIAREGGRLLGAQTGGGKVELIPISETTFVRRDADRRYVFERGAIVMRDKNSEVRAPRLGDDEHLPIELVMSGKVDEAVAAYKRMKKEDPGSRYVDEGRFNALGYQLLGAGKQAEAIAIFRLNTELYPASANTYDSLGEAYMESGDKEKAIANYEKSLELNPQNPNAVKTLEKLRGEE